MSDHEDVDGKALLRRYGKHVIALALQDTVRHVPDLLRGYTRESMEAEYAKISGKVMDYFLGQIYTHANTVLPIDRNERMHMKGVDFVSASGHYGPHFQDLCYRCVDPTYDGPIDFQLGVLRDREQRIDRDGFPLFPFMHQRPGTQDLEAVVRRAA